MVGKDHRHLLGDIRRYCEQLGETKIGLSDFFETSTYQSEQGKGYNVTKLSQLSGIGKSSMYLLEWGYK